MRAQGGSGAAQALGAAGQGRAARMEAGRVNPIPSHQPPGGDQDGQVQAGTSRRGPPGRAEGSWSLALLQHRWRAGAALGLMWQGRGSPGGGWAGSVSPVRAIGAPMEYMPVFLNLHFK